MIKTTVGECVTAYRALRRINEEVRLPQKPAWRIARLLNKIKSVVVDYDATQDKLFRDAGAVPADGGLRLEDPKREDGETLDTFQKRKQNYLTSLNNIHAEQQALGKESVEIDYDLIPLSLLQDDEKTDAPGKQRRYSANDFADASSFFSEKD